MKNCVKKIAIMTLSLDEYLTLEKIFIFSRLNSLKSSFIKNRKIEINTIRQKKNKFLFHELFENNTVIAILQNCGDSQHGDGVLL